MKRVVLTAIVTVLAIPLFADETKEVWPYYSEDEFKITLNDGRIYYSHGIFFNHDRTDRFFSYFTVGDLHFNEDKLDMKDVKEIKVIANNAIYEKPSFIPTKDYIITTCISPSDCKIHFGEPKDITAKIPADIFKILLYDGSYGIALGTFISGMWERRFPYRYLSPSKPNADGNYYEVSFSVKQGKYSNDLIICVNGHCEPVPGFYYRTRMSYRLDLRVHNGIIEIKQPIIRFQPFISDQYSDYYTYMYEIKGKLFNKKGEPKNAKVKCAYNTINGTINKVINDILYVLIVDTQPWASKQTS